MDDKMFVKTGIKYGPEKLKGKYHRMRSVHTKFGELINNTGVTWSSTTSMVNADESVWDVFFKRDKIFKTFKKKGCLGDNVGGFEACEGQFDVRGKRNFEDLENEYIPGQRRALKKKSASEKYDVLMQVWEQSINVKKERDLAKAERYKSQKVEAASLDFDEYSINKCRKRPPLGSVSPSSGNKGYRKKITQLFGISSVEEFRQILSDVAEKKNPNFSSSLMSGRERLPLGSCNRYSESKGIGYCSDFYKDVGTPSHNAIRSFNLSQTSGEQYKIGHTPQTSNVTGNTSHRHLLAENQDPNILMSICNGGGGSNRGRRKIREEDVVTRGFIQWHYKETHAVPFDSVVPVIVIKTQNPIIDPEINGLGDIISAVDEVDVEFDDTKKRIELQPDSVHHVLGEICSADSSSSSHNYEDTVDTDVHISSDDQINMEQLSRVSKPEDGAEVMETSSMSDDKLLDNLKKDQVHQAMHVTIHKELEITASHYICERIMIAKTLWGIWYFRNKMVWDFNFVTAARTYKSEENYLLYSILSY
ncbi:hypothetical protein AgCh_035170 [Apium graveolens]